MLKSTMKTTCFLFITLILSVSAWDDDDLEVFDVVEEVNQNFYELLGVAQDSTASEIKTAFRKLTLILHPDKNDSPDADVQFRNLVSVHNILKDPGKREKYNEVLKNGLPNWRSAIYYYRHVRKMGLAEGSLILFIIISFGQYLVGWAAYAEKRFTAQQILNSRSKRSKKSGFDAGLAEILDQLPKPSVKDTLPFQIPKGIWWSITAIPHAVVELKRRRKQQEEEERRRIKREEEEKVRAAEEAVAAEAAREARGARRRRGFVPPARERGGAPDVMVKEDRPPRTKNFQCSLEGVADRDAAITLEFRYRPSPPIVSGGLWTDDDLAELSRLMSKFPGGSAGRWERVAGALRRPVAEVTHMAARLKENGFKMPQEEPVVVEMTKKVKTRKAEETSGGTWSQSQQRALETALAKHPKGGAGDRWAKIAAAVSGKTKEECMQRCKYLSEMVKKQKQKEEEELRAAEEAPSVIEEISDS